MISQSCCTNIRRVFVEYFTHFGELYCGASFDLECKLFLKVVGIFVQALRKQSGSSPILVF